MKFRDYKELGTEGAVKVRYLSQLQAIMAVKFSLLWSVDLLFTTLTINTVLPWSTLVHLVTQLCY